MPGRVDQFARKGVHNRLKVAKMNTCCGPKRMARQRLASSSRTTNYLEELDGFAELSLAAANSSDKRVAVQAAVFEILKCVRDINASKDIQLMLIDLVMEINNID